MSSTTRKTRYDAYDDDAGSPELLPVDFFGKHLEESPQPARGLAYLIGIAIAAICGTLFFMGGLATGVSGPSAIVLAAGFPAAALLWALTLSIGSRNRR